MDRTAPTFGRRAPLLAAALLACALLPAACSSEPETVLQSDLPQVPGMVARDSSGLKQDGSQVLAGQFSYKGEVSDLPARAAETKARFLGQGWTLRSEAVTGSTAVLEFRKGERDARVEIIRNGVQPKMSTAVLRVTPVDPGGPVAPTAPPAPAAAAPASK